MKVLFILIALIGMLSSCSKKPNTTFSGSIGGLSKGKLYLQQIHNGVLITLDSVSLNGSDQFNFNLDLDEPDMFLFYLDKTDGNVFNDRLKVFLSPGKNEFIAKLNDFKKTAKITGSPNQEKLKEYNAMIQKFNLNDFKLSQLNQFAQKTGKEKFVNAVNSDYDNFLKRKYLYTVNFALTNKHLEIAPYIVVTEIPDANPKYLDTIYKSLPETIKASKYGIKLKEMSHQQ